MSKSIIIQAVPTIERPDGVVVPLEYALTSVTINDLYKDMGGNVEVFPVQGGQNNNTIENVFNYVQRNIDRFPKIKEGTTEAAGKTQRELAKEDYTKTRGDPLDEKNVKFFNDLVVNGQGPLFDFMLAVNYLEMELPLQDCAKFVASEIKGKSPEDIRKIFSVERPAEVKS